MINPGNSLKKRGCDPHIKPGFKRNNSGLQCYSKSILEGANVNLLDVALKASSFAPKAFMKLQLRPPLPPINIFNATKEVVWLDLSGGWGPFQQIF